jgi:ribosomal protein L3
MFKRADRQESRMTQIFDETGSAIPVTIIEAGPVM